MHKRQTAPGVFIDAARVCAIRCDTGSTAAKATSPMVSASTSPTPAPDHQPAPLCGSGRKSPSRLADKEGHVVRVLHAGEAGGLSILVFAVLADRPDVPRSPGRHSRKYHGA